MTLAITLVGRDKTSTGLVPAVVLGRFDGDVEATLATALQSALEGKDWGRASILAERAGLSLALSAPPSTKPVYEVPVDPASLIEVDCCQ